MRDPIRLAVETLEMRRLLAVSPVLVGDVNPTTDQLGAASAVQVGSVSYFAGRPNAADGFELFKTDGTTAGTTLVKDINTATSGLDTGSSPDLLTNVNGTLYFVASDGTTGRELWKSNGTAAGTVRVADLNSGAGSSNPNSLTNVNGTLYFLANDGSGEVLWKSDGTAGTTQKVSVSGGPSSISGRSLVAYNNQLLFAGGSNFNIHTATGTTATLVTGSPNNARYLTVMNGQVYFTINTSSTSDSNRGDLWKTDGTSANTGLVKAINFTSGSSEVTSTAALTASGDRLYFVTGNSISGQYNLWVSDGTNAGTVALTTSNGFTLSDTFVPFGVRSVFFVSSSASTGTEPFVSDGTVGGTAVLINATAGGASSVVGGATVLPNGKLLFTTASNYAQTANIYLSDGTTATTTTSASINTTPGYALVIGKVGSSALINSLRTFGQGDLFKSDGTAAGTSRIGASGISNGSGLSDYNPSGGATVLAVGNTVYFAADDGINGNELWQSVNGATPTRITQIGANGADSSPSNLTAAPDGGVYFTTQDPVTGVRSIYRYGPNSAGTATVLTLVATPGTNQTLSQLVAIGNQLFYVASGGSLTRPQLRYYNSTNGNGGPLSVNGVFFASPSQFVKAGNSWYFGALPSTSTGTITNVQRLYSMGDVNYTVPSQATDINSGISGATYVPQPIGAVGSTVYFLATLNVTGTELWSYSDPAVGAQFVADINPGSGSTSVTVNDAYPAAENNGVLYFSAFINGSDALPYRTDGTSSGTRLVDAALPTGRYFSAANGQMYFIGTSSTGVTSLYRDNGNGTTTALPTGGTGTNAFTPTRLYSAGGSLFAFGTGGTNERFELWRIPPEQTTLSKITTLGPRVSPTLPGSLNSFFGFGRYGVTNTATDLYFPMYSPSTGVELNKFLLATTGTVSGVVFDDIDASGTRTSDEGPTAGVTVYLDANNNSTLDTGERSIVSTTSGYTFTNVQPGTYRVRLVALTDGRRITTPNLVPVVTVSEGVTNTIATDFGVTTQSGSAVISGPGTVAEGASITLDGSNSSEPFGTIVGYEWDLNYDGSTFDIDATGVTTTFSAAQLDGPSTRTVAMRVIDDNGVTSAPTTRVISITNVAPTAQFAGGGPVIIGAASSVSFSNATDIAVADRTGLIFSYDFNNDGDFADAGEIAGSSSASASYAYGTAGTFTVRGRVTDKDGGFTDYTTNVTVFPTSSGPDAASVFIEAESGTLTAGTTRGTGNAGYTGTGYADYGNQNSAAEWTITRNNAGPVNISFRYANGGASDRPLTIYVNGAVVGTLAFSNTGGWTTWISTSINANLVAGTNTIKAIASTSTGGANVDSLTVNTVVPSWMSSSADAVYSLSNNTLVVYSGTVTLLTDAATASPGLAVIVGSGGNVVLNTTQHLSDLNISGTASMTGGSKLLRVSNLSINAGGQLDLADNDMIIDYLSGSPAAQVRGWLLSGRSGGTWTGSGLVSSTARSNSNRAFGYTEAAAYRAQFGSNTPFHGESVSGNALLIKYTWAGDATFDGSVNFNDFLAVQNSFGSSNASFTQGDFDYNGSVNFNDFLTLQNSFGLGPAAGRAAVKLTK